jgi:hypothetical protein
MSEERRKFERVHLPAGSGVYASSHDGEQLGELRMLGRGGFQVDTTQDLKIGTSHSVFIVDESESIRRQVQAVVRNLTHTSLVGFEFDDLGADAAVEIGVIIGKYYSASIG